MSSIGIKNMIDILSNKDYIYVPDNEEKVKELLIGHSIKKIKNKNILELDNGILLEFYGNDGCICGSGDYEITELSGCNNIITDVEFIDEELDNYGEEHRYKIYVYAENKKIKILQCDGDDGNGWYGTGYHIEVKYKKKVGSDNNDNK